jgi:hypothetical protein
MNRGLTSRARQRAPRTSGVRRAQGVFMSIHRNEDWLDRSNAETLYHLERLFRRLRVGTPRENSKIGAVLCGTMSG